MSLLAFVLLPMLVAEPLRTAPLSEFDGKSWSGIRLNEDTDSDIKRAYRTEKGAVRPEALKIVTDRPRDVRVDTLLDGRGGKAVVRAIRVEYLFEAPTLDSLETAFGEKATDNYQVNRNDDWKVVAFPDHGVLGISVNGTVSTFLLTNPQGIAKVVGNMHPDETRIVPVPDPGADWSRTVLFGDTSATIYLGDNAPNDFDDTMRRRIRDAVTDSLEGVRGRELRFSNRADGSLSASVRTGKFSDDGTADCTVALELSAATPYGKLERSASNTRKIRPRYRDAILNIVDDTLSDLRKSTAAAANKLGPPSPEQTRQYAMMTLYRWVTGV